MSLSSVSHEITNIPHLLNPVEKLTLGFRAKTWQNSKKFLIISSLGLGLLLSYGCSQNSASQQNEDFTNNSLEGTYAMVDLGQGGQATVVGTTLATFDGQGKFEGRTIQSFPGQDVGSPRRMNQATFSGQYQVEGNGNGTGMIATNLPDGSTNNNNLNFVITKAQRVNQELQAEEFYLIPEQLVPAGNLMTVMGKRLPDGVQFSNASLKGNYAYRIVGQDGQIPQSGEGVLTCDGQGNCTGKININQPATSGQGRAVVATDVVRPYTINGDGTGTATPANESAMLLLITKADVVNNNAVAQEVFFIVQDVDTTTQNLVTGWMTKLPD